MEGTIIEIHDYCMSYRIDIDGVDFKDHKDRKGFIKELIDKLDDCELESVLSDLIQHINTSTEEEYYSSTCDQCGDWNTYQKIILDEKICL